MTEEIVEKIRRANSFKNAKITSVSLEKTQRKVTIKLITDLAYTKDDYAACYNVLRGYVPQEFTLNLEISKLTPDSAIIERKISEIMQKRYPALYSVMGKGDISVTKRDGGFDFIIYTVASPEEGKTAAKEVEKQLRAQYCGEFYGSAQKSRTNLAEIEVEEEEEEEEYVFVPRTFPVTKFVPIETPFAPERAVYISDCNFESEKLYLCGYITDISERSYIKRTTGEEKLRYSITIKDPTGTKNLTYFPRKKSLEKIRTLTAGEGIVCECRAEIYNESLTFTAVNIDRGCPPEDFRIEKRKSKPVPKRYNCIKPQPFSDCSQTGLFRDDTLPPCLKEHEFVVFDLETTGLQSVPINGEMDGIIEIGAFKIKDGEICEKFSTFVNPLRSVPLSQKIIELTGITDADVNSAPSYKEVLPDFVKFCNGAILVGHNVVNFDFRFIDKYTKDLGYEIVCPLIDTLPLAQKLLTLANNKLNTVADHFGITFNHHRAEDDALATAKIFIELIKIKKSLPL